MVASHYMAAIGQRHVGSCIPTLHFIRKQLDKSYGVDSIAVSRNQDENETDDVPRRVHVHNVNIETNKDMANEKHDNMDPVVLNERISTTLVVNKPMDVLKGQNEGNIVFRVNQVVNEVHDVARRIEETVDDCSKIDEINGLISPKIFIKDIKYSACIKS